MPLTGTSGVEDRVVSTYNAVFNFDGPVTSGQVQLISGTATVGAVSFIGNSMTAAITGVTSAEIVTLRALNINGDGLPHGDVPFGFLTGDADASRVVGKSDQTLVQGQVNQPVTSDEVLFLSETGTARTPAFFVPDCFHNKGNYVISLGNVTRWLAQQAENLGVEIFPGFAAAEVLYNDNGSVKGVATGNLGIGKDGEPDRKSTV